MASTKETIAAPRKKLPPARNGFHRISADMPVA